MAKKKSNLSEKGNRQKRARESARKAKERADKKGKFNNLLNQPNLNQL